MRAFCIVLTVCLAAAGPVLSQGEVRMIAVAGEGAKYWPRWRGPSGQGVVGAGKYTNTWSPTSHVKWRVPVAAGNSSPIVWGDRIYLTASQDYGRKLSMLAFNRADGKPLWETFIAQDG